MYRIAASEKSGEGENSGHDKAIEGAIATLDARCYLEMEAT